MNRKHKQKELILQTKTQLQKHPKEKVKGVKQLNIDIGSYKQSLFLEITNSAMEIETKNFKTTKKVPFSVLLSLCFSFYFLYFSSPYKVYFIFSFST